MSSGCKAKACLITPTGCTSEPLTSDQIKFVDLRLKDGTF